MDYYQNNLELWAKEDPKQAVLLPYLKQGDIFHCLTEVGEDNLFRKRETGLDYFHSQSGAIAEAKSWFFDLEIQGHDVLYVFGIGLGYYYEAMSSWLLEDSTRTLVFLEDDLHVIAEFLKTERAYRLLQDSQVHLIYFKDAEAKKDVLAEVYWNFALTKATVSALHYYKIEKASIYQEICHEISYSSDLKRALLDEYLDYGAHFFVNFYRNLLHLSESYLGDKLFGKFRGIPAIICGAGPSLEKNGTLLKQLTQRALIFSGGSSTNILNEMGIQPHFCAGIDPNDAQRVRLNSNQAFEVPFFYRQRLNYGAFLTVHGPHLYVTGSGGYDVAEYFEKQLGIEGQFFEEGHNVINFAMEIAYQMGCNPIIFVGMDLAFTDKKTYSSGVTFDPSVEQRTLDEYANFETEGLLRKDIFGHPIYTLWKWVAEAEWIGNWARDHEESRLINCTEGGLGFPEVPNQPLVEIVRDLLSESYDLQGQVHLEVQNSRMPNVTQQKVEIALLELRDSLKRCCSDFEILIEDVENLKSRISSEKAVAVHHQSGKAALVELELAEEPAYLAVIEIFNTVYSRLLNKELVKIKGTGKSEWNKQFLRLQLNQRKLQFLNKVAHVNVGLIDFALEEYANEKTVSKSPEKEFIYVSAKTPEVIRLSYNAANDSCKQGIWRTYYPNGELKGESNYKSGVLDGISQFYSEAGVLLSSSTYLLDQLEGEVKRFYPSGEKYSILNYFQGLPHGKHLYYYANGKLKSELEYEHGRLIGNVLLYGSDGSLKREITLLDKK